MSEPIITIELPLNQAQELMYAASIGHADGDLYRVNDPKNQTPEEKERWILFVRASSKLGFACVRAGIQEIISKT